VTRRDLIALLASAAAALPFHARAQQREPMRRIGVLMLYPESDPEGLLRATAFQQELEKLGWTVGRNIQIDFQWGLGDADWIQSAAEHLLRLTPDLILANGDAATKMVQKSTRTVPIVFIAGSDPVAEGLVPSLAHPGGNLTGFLVLEPSLGEKLLELLKEIAPSVARIAVLFNPNNPGNQRLAASAMAAAPKFAVDVAAAPLRNSTEIEAAMERWGRDPQHGLIVLPDPSTNSHRKIIIELAARYRLPAIHALRAATAEGGLMSYGVDLPDLFRQAATYADRILKGDKPSVLPVQLPTKFELAINRRTATALGLTVPNTLLVSADEVIE
jgi:putative tryptophan/tyrosine transport system substrate-binding protein